MIWRDGGCDRTVAPALRFVDFTDTRQIMMMWKAYGFTPRSHFREGFRGNSILAF